MIFKDLSKLSCRVSQQVSNCITESCKSIIGGSKQRESSISSKCSVKFSSNNSGLKCFVTRTVYYDIDNGGRLRDHSVNYMYHTIVSFNVCHGDLCLVDVCHFIEQRYKSVCSFEHFNDLAIGEVTGHYITTYNMVLQNVGECTGCISKKSCLKAFVNIAVDDHIYNRVGLNRRSNDCVDHMNHTIGCLVIGEDHLSIIDKYTVIVNSYCDIGTFQCGECVTVGKTS